MSREAKQQGQIRSNQSKRAGGWIYATFEHQQERKAPYLFDFLISTHKYTHLLFLLATCIERLSEEKQIRAHVYLILPFFDD